MTDVTPLPPNPFSGNSDADPHEERSGWLLDAAQPQPDAHRPLRQQSKRVLMTVVAHGIRPTIIGRGALLAGADFAQPFATGGSSRIHGHTGHRLDLAVWSS